MAVKPYRWAPMISVRDAGGLREFVDGKAVHCGATLYLQARERYSYKDEHGDTQEDYRLLQSHVVVRFEITYLRKFILDRVPCDMCKGTGQPCGKPPLPDDDAKCGPTPWGDRFCLGGGDGCVTECSHCDGTGNIAGRIVGNQNGSWQSIRTPMLHHFAGLTEFTTAVTSGMRFRWP